MINWSQHHDLYTTSRSNERKKLAWGRKITLNEVAISTGISRAMLFRIIKNEGYS